MQTMRVSEKSDKDGVLHLRIPVGLPDAEFEAIIVFRPKTLPAPASTPEDRGWPPGYFENTCGSIDDDTFMPQAK